MLLPLKIKILESGRTQRELSLCSRIPETRLSAIVRGRVASTAEERRALARVLGQPVDALFSSPAAPTTPESA